MELSSEQKTISEKLEEKFPVSIENVLLHKSNWISVIYSFIDNYKDLRIAHIEIKGKIHNCITSLIDREIKGIRIINYSLKQKRTITNIQRKINNRELVRRSIETEIATQDNDNIGYMTRSLVMGSMPHNILRKTYFDKKGNKKEVEINECVRINGNFTLSMIAPSKVGLPYGTKARMIMSYIVKEAITKKTKTIYLGDSLKEFMSRVGYPCTGGAKGTLILFMEQLKRLLSTSIVVNYDDRSNNHIEAHGKHIKIAKSFSLWMDVTNYSSNRFDSVIELDDDFYQEIISGPIPLDIRALNALKSSSYAFDIYCFLTYRNSYLEKPTIIKWKQLEEQFGSGYERRRDFKRKFSRELEKVNSIYKTNAKMTDIGLLLEKSEPHINKRYILPLG